MSSRFIRNPLHPVDYWRGIVLFGRNVATYKFALARALLDLKPVPGQILKLEDLASPFSRHLCDHLRLADKQGTFKQSRFLDACRRANAGEISQEKLIEETVRLGFVNVIDAFHIVGQREVDLRFFMDERSGNAGIRATDALWSVFQGEQSGNLPDEAEARWRLVETAWELGLSRSVVTVNLDPKAEGLFVIDSARRRRSVTGVRTALSGYQKGHCFYCLDAFSLRSATPPEVDHFFPHTLKSTGLVGAIDGVWNLVLACARCNRGVGGKSDRVPSLRLLERLHTRNEFLIGSHHPLRETLMSQTGATETDRQRFLNSFHTQALTALLHEWQPAEVVEPPF